MREKIRRFFRPGKYRYELVMVRDFGRPHLVPRLMPYDPAKESDGPESNYGCW